MSDFDADDDGQSATAVLALRLLLSAAAGNDDARDDTMREMLRDGACSACVLRYVLDLLRVLIVSDVALAYLEAMLAEEVDTL